MKRPTLSLIGAGKAGGSLARQWHAKGGFKVVALHTRSGRPELAADIAAQEIKYLEQMPPCDALMIATGDPAITPIAQQLAALDKVDWHKKVVFHISGALAASALQPLADKGALIASAHPVRAFSHAQTDVDGTWIGMEGQSQALALLRPAFLAIGGQCFTTDGSEKVKYHAAAVIASNHLIALAHASQQLWVQAGIDQNTAQALFQSLAQGVLHNLEDNSPEKALTGPIARHDPKTVATHMQELKAHNSDTAALYHQLSLYLIESLNLPHSDAQKQKLIEALSVKPT